jgi:hypothetical protein
MKNEESELIYYLLCRTVKKASVQQKKEATLHGGSGKFFLTKTK